jgi:photosystem II stability/assembly factor-like uncharacterized protein
MRGTRGSVRASLMWALQRPPRFTSVTTSGRPEARRPRSRVALLVVLAFLCAGQAAPVHAGAERRPPVGVPVVSGPLGGEIQVVLVAPSNGDIAYALTGGGLFLTRNGGRSWALRPGPTPGRLFAVDPSRPFVLYASDGKGLIRSRDAGRHWRALGVRVPGYGPSALVADPRRRGRLYLGTERSLYRSTDDGAHWKEIAPVAAPGGDGPRRRLPAGTLAINRRGGLILASEGLYRSDDGGDHWRTLDEGAHARSLAVDPRRTGTFYVASDDANIWGAPIFQQAGVFRTRDDGRTWTRIAEGHFDQIVVDPSAPSTLYGRTQLPFRLLRTRDAGTTWKEIGRKLPGSASSIAPAPGTGARLYLGTAADPTAISRRDPPAAAGGGVFISTDRGVRWRSANTGLAGTLVGAVATAPRCPARSYASTLGNRLFSTRDGGRRWRRPIEPPPALARGADDQPLTLSTLAVDAGSATRVYAGSNLGVWLTVDGGVSWRALASAPTDVYVLAAHPTRPGVVYASTATGLSVTRDGGSTWSQVTLPVPSITAVVFHPRRPEVVFVATRIPLEPGSPGSPAPPRLGDGIYGSTDGGSTWTSLNQGLGDAHIAALALDPRRAATLYAATESHGIYRTTDGGGHWKPTGSRKIHFGLGQPAVTVLAVDPIDGTLFADSGAYAPQPWIWRSGDGGGSWSPVAPNILHTGVAAMTIDGSGTVLDVATLGLGVVRIPLRRRASPSCRGE